MKKDEVSFLIRLADPKPLSRGGREGRADRLLNLKERLEQLNIQVEHLELLGQLVVHAPEEVWGKAIDEIGQLEAEGFDIEPNRLL